MADQTTHQLKAQLRRPRTALCALGTLATLIAAFADPHKARSAASQDWPPFVLVTGLLLVGLIAERDGFFAACGRLVARSAKSETALLLAAGVLILAVTATLNLDTSVAFLTPVLVYASRERSSARIVAAVILLSNAGSLLLPGSNLTNLIVLGHGQLSGSHFVARTWLPWLGSCAVTGLVLLASERRARDEPSGGDRLVDHRTEGTGLLAIGITTALVLVLRAPALPVLAVGTLGVIVACGRRRLDWREALEGLGLPTLVALFGLAVAMGTLGRAWPGPATLLRNLDPWGTAALGAGLSVTINNLPAASLLAARTPAHPVALLIGLDVGPNLFVTGSLAWFLWIRAGRIAGARPPIGAALRLGLLSAPLAMAAAIGLLVLSGAR
jgi:arsenical pump membrane protein